MSINMCASTNIVFSLFTTVLSHCPLSHVSEVGGLNSKWVEFLCFHTHSCVPGIS